MQADPPTLLTARLRLRTASGNDLPTLHTLWSHAEVRRFLFDDAEVTEALAAQVLADALAVPLGGLWILELRDGGAVVGCAGLLPTTVAARFDPALAGLLEPLVALDPAHWHRGLAIEALAALVAFAFGPRAQSRLAAVNDLPNLASERMLRRVGFQPVRDVPGPRHALRTYRLEREP